MRAIRADLPTGHKSIELLVLADFHYGSPNADRGLIRKDVEYVRDHENAYCVLAGDLLDCAIKTSLGDVYTNMSPMQELNELAELLRPVSRKVVGVVPGNHEARHYKTNGVDVTRILVDELGISSQYVEDAAVIFLRFGEDQSRNGHHRPICYTVYLTHGNGGGRKEGGKIQRLADYADIVDCDCYICGHTHLPAALKLDFARTSPGNSSISYAPHLFVNAAAKLRYNGYGCSGGFKPPNTDTPRIVFDGQRKHMEAVI